MPQVAVITDTDSSLPASLAQQLNVIQVPITVHFASESFSTGLDIDDQALFERIDRTGQLPTTSAPSPSAFAKAFQAALDGGADSIVCICVSSRISSTYNSAITAREEFPTRQISVIDSLSLSVGQSFMVIQAAQAAQAGLPHDEVAACAANLVGRGQIFGSLTTLKYLAMGGRVGKLAAGMADMLNIRPILKGTEGKLDLLEKVRTHRAAMDRLAELIIQAAQGRPLEYAAFTHVNNPQDVSVLESRLREHLQFPDQVLTAEFTPGLSVHAGRGLIGFAFITAE